MKRIAAIIIIALAIAAGVFWFVESESDGRPPPFLGYVEAETILVAPKATGRLVALDVARGDEIAADARLFALDDDNEKAALNEAAAEIERARAQLADLRAARQRPEQIEMLEARRQEATAALDLSRAELARQQKLFDQGYAAESRLDQARSTFRRDSSVLAEIEREIDAAQLPGRADEIAAAEAAVAAAEAAQARARIALDERVVATPYAGRVLDTMYRVGEVVPAGQPVVEMLPPANIKLRFYVPETSVAGLSYGQTVAIGCDSCPQGLRGTITFIAPQAEFTPPVIFSRQERAKLVFLVQARPAKVTEALRPGLPIEVRPQ